MLSAAHPRQLTQYSGIALRAGILTVLLVITLAVVGGKDTFSFISLNRSGEVTPAFVPSSSNAAEVGSFRFVEANNWDHRHIEGVNRLTNILFVENNAWDYRPVSVSLAEMVFAELNGWDHQTQPERFDTSSIWFSDDNRWDHTNRPIFVDYGIQNR